MTLERRVVCTGDDHLVALDRLWLRDVIPNPPYRPNEKVMTLPRITLFAPMRRQGCDELAERRASVATTSTRTSGAGPRCSLTCSSAATGQRTIVHTADATRRRSAPRS